MGRPVPGYRYVAISFTHSGLNNLPRTDSADGLSAMRASHASRVADIPDTDPRIILVGNIGETRGNVKQRAVQLLVDVNDGRASDGDDEILVVSYSAVALAHGAALREYEFKQHEQAVREVVQQAERCCAPERPDQPAVTEVARLLALPDGDDIIYDRLLALVCRSGISADGAGED